MNSLTEFRKNQGNTAALSQYLNSPEGQEFVTLLREIRAGMVNEKNLSEGRICGRHDVFQQLDDLFFVGSKPHEPKPTLPTSKSGGKIKPHQTKLP